MKWGECAKALSLDIIHYPLFLDNRTLILLCVAMHPDGRSHSLACAAARDRCVMVNGEQSAPSYTNFYGVNSLMVANLSYQVEVNWLGNTSKDVTIGFCNLRWAGFSTWLARAEQQDISIWVLFHFCFFTLPVWDADNMNGIPWLPQTMKTT